MHRITAIILCIGIIGTMLAPVAQAGVFDTLIKGASCASGAFLGNVLANIASISIDKLIDAAGNIPIIGGFIRSLFGDGQLVKERALRNKETVNDVIARCLARVFFDNTISRILDVARTKGRDGGPTYIQNWRNFQTNAQYRGEEVFRTILANTAICNYLNTDIKKAFRVTDAFKLPLKGQNIRIGDLDPFTLRAKCSLPESFDLSKYQKDFSANGGWDAFLRLNESQNNSFGLMFESFSELDKQRNLELTSDLQEAQAGQGNLSVRGDSSSESCLVKAPSGKCVFYNTIKTPGSYITDSLAATVQQELAWVTNVDEINELVTALFSRLGERMLDLQAPEPTPVYEGDPQIPDEIACTEGDPSCPIGTEGQCTGFGASSCPGQGGVTRPNCGNSPGSIAYDLRVHHVDMYTDPSGVRYLWNIGAAGDPNNPYTWVWLEAPDANDITNWCDGSAKDAWIAEHSISSPVSTPPPYQGTRCLDGGTGVCTGSGSSGGGGNNGGGGGNDGCAAGEVLTQPGGTMNGGVNAAIDSACGQYCSGTNVTNLTGYINAVVGWLNSNGYQARHHSEYGEGKNITVKQGGNFTEDFAIWSGSDTNPQVRRAYSFTCTPGGSSGGSGGGRGTCDAGATLDDNPNGGTMNSVVGSAVGSACSQYCSGSGSQPAISNLTGYINAVVGWLNSNGYQARWHSGYGDAKNITVKRPGGSFSEDFQIWAGTDAEPRSLGQAYAFRCTPASAY